MDELTDQMTEKKRDSQTMLVGESVSKSVGLD